MSVSRKVIAIVVVALLGTAAVVAGLRTFGPARYTPPKHVVVLALDGATWDLLDPLMERGLLPNLERLRKGGAWAPLASMEPSSSPVIWTTVATGKSPEQHGITFFVRFPDGNLGKPSPVASSMRRTKAIWNILGESGKDVAVVGWFVTWPAEAVNGRVISDRAHYGDISGGMQARTFPPFYLSTLAIPGQAEAVRALPRFMDFDYDPDHIDKDARDRGGRKNFLVFDRFVRAYLRDLYYLGAVEAVLADGRLPDFLAFYLRGTDDVQHGFWQYMEPDLFEDVPIQAVASFGHTIENYWQWTDEAVGRVLSHYGPDTLVVVLSDHGAGPAVGEHGVVAREHLHLSGSHRDEGIIIVNGPGVKKGAGPTDGSVYDITPTLLYAMGMPVALDMDGRVLDGFFTGAVARHAVAPVATYETSAALLPTDVTSPPQVEKQILEHLRSLGYID